MNRLLEDAARRAAEYLDALPTRAVAPLPAAILRLRSLEEPLPEHPQSPEAVLRRIETGSPATAAMAGGRFLVSSSEVGLPITVASNWLATAWDKCRTHGPTPGVAAFEHAALRWLLRNS